MKHLPLHPTSYRDLPANSEPDHGTVMVRVADDPSEPAGALRYGNDHIDKSSAAEEFAVDGIQNAVESMPSPTSIPQC